MSNRRSRYYNQDNLNFNDNRRERYEYNRDNHVHEVQGSVEIAGADPHNHRFATVSGEAIQDGGTHCHEVKFRTDTYGDHCHEFCGKTSRAIPVGGGRHVHYLEAITSVDDGHRHSFRCATLIEDPTGYEC